MAGQFLRVAEPEDLLLDDFEDMGLKSFEEIDATPTTAVTSLPQTPHDAPRPLLQKEEHVVRSVPPSVPYRSIFRPFDNEPRIEAPETTVPPDAPRLKDLDSFTDGTGAGSFDSLPAASMNEHGEPVYPVTRHSLGTLRDMRDQQTERIESWRADVHIATPSHPPAAPTTQPSTLPPTGNAAVDALEAMLPNERESPPAPAKRSHSTHSSLVEDEEERKKRTRPSPRPGCMSAPARPSPAMIAGSTRLPLPALHSQQPPRPQSTPPRRDAPD